MDGGKILWQYLVDLHKLQNDEGLRLGNKSKKAHIQWKQQKMKVNLAAQSLSSSVADAIEYCATILKLPQFQGSEATVKFLRMFDHLASSVQRPHLIQLCLIIMIKFNFKLT